MRYVGYNELFHDAGLAIISEEGNIEFAGHAERYKKVKNWHRLTPDLWDMVRDDDVLAYYEDPKARYEEYTKYRIDKFSNRAKAEEEKRRIHPSLVDFDVHFTHHQSHAATGFYTRPWEEVEGTVMLTIDGHGEIESSAIYDCNFNKLSSTLWPQSIGGIYAFATKALGFKPLEEEYIVMGLSSYGEADDTIVAKIEEIYNDLDATEETVFGIINNIYRNTDGLTDENFAASVQKWTEDKIYERALEARKYGNKLIYSGGVAQNILANTKIRDLFDDMWIPPACTDGGSALGCAALAWGEATGKTRINWKDAYLGYNIDRTINPREVVDYLLDNRHCGIANGRAEWGPRALGNRSIIADVRYSVKDTINVIKRRQRYRPFAPAVLEEFAGEYFEGHMNQYMHYTAKALHDYSSVTHVDGTARVQTVPKDSSSIIRKVLEEYYERTGVPMLLNTSLNIRGLPIVNDSNDARLFEQRYGIKVF